MLDDLQPTLRFAIMTILATVYETGIVEELDMADVMRLFGAQPEPGVTTRFSFNDEGWIEAYIDFRESNTDDLLDETEFGEDPQDLSLDRKLH